MTSLALHDPDIESNTAWTQDLQGPAPTVCGFTRNHRMSKFVEASRERSASRSWCLHSDRISSGARQHHRSISSTASLTHFSTMSRLKGANLPGARSHGQEMPSLSPAPSPIPSTQTTRYDSMECSPGARCAGEGQFSQPHLPIQGFLQQDTHRP